MNPHTVARVITRRAPLPRRRGTPYGAWVRHAKEVAALVGFGWTVTNAVRKVVETMRLVPADIAFHGIRARYYADLKRKKDKDAEEFPI